MFRLIAFPALAVISLATADVSSLSLSSTEVAFGGSTMATVVVGGGTGMTRVALNSSAPSVATVPPSVLVGRARRATFRVSAVSGAAGCTTISARQGTTAPKTVLFFVQPPVSPEAPVRLTLSTNSVAGGSSLSATVTATPSASSSTVHLSSSNPAVTVPASVQLSPGAGGSLAATFDVATALVSPSTCSVITAKFSGSQARALLKVASISG